MIKILYLMNVEWNWIKQRPHFIAELLNKNDNYNVTICYPRRFNRKGLQERNNNGLDLEPLKLIPKISGYENLRFINDQIMAIQVKKIIAQKNPDLLYLTYPTQVMCIPANYSGKVIYDCMDNHLSFYKSDFAVKKLLNLESELITKSDHVFVSSNYLQNLLINRNQNIELTKKISLLRNAYDGNICTLKKNNMFLEKISNKYFKMAYFGTISSWFNFNFLLKSLADYQNIEYYLYGPIDGIEIPNDDRIHYEGTIEHDHLYEAIKDKDCLIMPFKLNEIIQAVDPVKLYEYINFNKNILTIEYPEIERFSPFVYFYNDYQSFIKQIRTIMNSKQVKYSNEERLSFLKDNTWEKRAEEIEQYIDSEVK